MKFFKIFLLKKLIIIVALCVLIFPFYQLVEGHLPVNSGKPGVKEDCLAVQTKNLCNVDIILQKDPKGIETYFLPRVMMVPSKSIIVWENHDNVTHNISGYTSEQLELTQSNQVKTYGKENILGVNLDSGDIKPVEKFHFSPNRTGLFIYYDKNYPEAHGFIFVYPETTQMNVNVEPVLSSPNVQTKWITGIAFTPDGRLFFTEHQGDVKIMDNGKLLDTPFLKLNEPSFFPNEDGKTPIYDDYPVLPWGWFGVTIDPNYKENHYVYLSRLFKVLDGKSPDNAMFQTNKMQLVRFTDVNNTATDLKILIDDIGGTEHTGGPIKFGHDGKIYFPTGDNGNGFDSQVLSKLTGKILRINPDGTIPEDNPFNNSPVFAYGFRNVFGIDAHPITGEFFVSENGPDRGDEINRIIAGKNYGWPVFMGDFLVAETMFKEEEDYVEPILEWQQTLGPSNAIFYKGNELDVLQNNFLVGTWNLGTLRMIILDEDNQNVKSEKLLFSGYKPIIAIAEGPDGFVYFSSIDGIERITNVTNEKMEDVAIFELGYSKSKEKFDFNMPVLLLEKLAPLVAESSSSIYYIIAILMVSIVGFLMFYFLKLKKIQGIKT